VRWSCRTGVCHNDPSQSRVRFLNDRRGRLPGASGRKWRTRALHTCGYLHSVHAGLPLPRTATAAHVLGLSAEGSRSLSSGSDQRLLLCAHDQEPQHDRQFSEGYGENDVPDRSLKLRQQDARKTENEVSEAVDQQPDAQDAGKEARPVHQEAERKEP